MTSRRLGRLVRLKKLMEQSRAADLAQEQAALGAAEADLRATHAEADALDTALAGSEASADDLMMAAAWQAQLARKADSQRQQIAAVASRVEERTGEVQTAWKERRLMQGMHERAVSREVAAEAGAENKTNEALALNAYGRRKDG